MTSDGYERRIDVSRSAQYVSSRQNDPRRILPIIVHVKATPVFKVSVDKDYLVFAAGHFITYDGVCETLHGHNYRARVEIEGELDENQLVVDFGVVKTIMRRLVDELDHKMLLPLENPRIVLHEQDDEVHVSYGKRRYVFPSHDVVLLPVANTTAELLARHLAQRLKDELGVTESTNLSSLVVEVEESFGQSAWYTERLDAPSRSEDRTAAG